MAHLDKGFTTRTFTTSPLHPVQVEGCLSQKYASEMLAKGLLCYDNEAFVDACSPVFTRGGKQSMPGCRKWSVLTEVIKRRHESAGSCLHAFLMSL